jgi:hypothetical protein
MLCERLRVIPIIISSIPVLVFSLPLLGVGALNAIPQHGQNVPL